MAKVFAPNEWFRKSFSSVRSDLETPSLMKLQLNSFNNFLQKEVPPARRDLKGLQAVFNAIFPITDFNNTVSLEFVSYSLEQPKYSERECKQRGLSYESPLKVTVRLVYYDTPEGKEEETITRLARVGFGCWKCR